MTHQHATLNDTVYFWFAANDTSGSGDDGASAAADIRLAGATASDAPILSPTPALLSHANYPAGCYEVAVAATTGNGFATTNTYAGFCTLAVDSQNPSGFIGSFTLDPIIANVQELVDDTQSAADLKDFADAGYNPADNKVQGVVLVDTTTANTDVRGTDSAALAANYDATRAGYLDNLSGHTPQTGDSYARLGGPAGVSVSADIAAIEAQTDDIGVAGAGLTAVPWNASWDTQVESEVTDALNAYGPPTVAEMNARTLVSASYFDPASDAVATVTSVTNDVGITQVAADKAWSSVTRTLSAFAFSVTVGTNNDKAGYSLSTAGILAIWDQLVSVLTTASTIGKLLVDNINATISSRSSHSAADVTGGTTVAAAETNIRGADSDTLESLSDQVDGVSTFDPTASEVDLGSIKGTALTETNAGDVAESFSFFYDVDPVTTKTVDDVGVAGSGITQQEVRDAMKLAPTGGAPAAGSVDTHLDTVEEDTDELQTDWVDAGRLDTILDGRSSHSAADVTGGTTVAAAETSIRGGSDTLDTLSDQLDAAQTDLDNPSQYKADVSALALEATLSALLTTPMTESYVANGSPPTVEQALFLIQQTIGDFSIAGTTITAKKIDGLAAAATYTLNDAVNPTSRTRAT